MDEWRRLAAENPLYDPIVWAVLALAGVAGVAGIAFLLKVSEAFGKLTLIERLLIALVVVAVLIAGLLTAMLIIW